jgi:hypothetical protein
MYLARNLMARVRGVIKSSPGEETNIIKSAVEAGHGEVRELVRLQ